MKIAYRPEIDGLRAVAVCAVIIYHAEPVIAGRQLLPGGFLGVDVFFVISGFLITSILDAELRSTGRLSIGHFYERRARRLLPALLLVMVASAPPAWYLLLPTQLTDYAQSAIYSLFFSSNFYWYLSLQEYGAESALLRPLLHTWTLAVEEQFYLLYPLFLLSAHRWVRRRTLLLTALILASLWLAERLSASDPSLSFYLLPTRLWELAVGGLLAGFVRRATATADASMIRRSMPAVGLLLILGSMALVTLDAHHPGLVTLIPVLGTGLVIYFGGFGEATTLLLSSRPLVYTGLLSYSLYLWHFPVFAFGRIIDKTPSVGLWAGLFALTVCLSMLGYHLVERPFRSPRRIRRRPFFVSLVAAVLVVVTVNLFFIYSPVATSRFETREEALGVKLDNTALAREAWEVLEQINIEHGYGAFKSAKRPATSPSRSEREALWYSENPRKTKVLVIGNSHSRDLFNALRLNEDLYEAEFARFAIRPTASSEAFRELVRSPNFLSADVLLISTRLFPRPEQYTVASDSGQAQALPGFLEKLAAFDKTLIVTSSSPMFRPYNGETNAVDGLLREDAQLSRDEVNRAYYGLLESSVLRLNREIADLARARGIRYLDKLDFICDRQEQTCTAITPEGRKTYYDGDHFSLEGARYFGRVIAERGWLALGTGSYDGDRP